MRLLTLRHFFLISGLLLAALGVIAIVGSAAAQPAARPAAQASPLHPTFPLLDDAGRNVLNSGGPVSTMSTCGQCHDTAFIASHSFHTDLGQSESTAPGQTGSGRPWDTSAGPFGKWNPLTYRYLSPAGDERIDLSSTDWVKFYAERLVGGGPAGAVEMNCFLCHLTKPNNDARIETIQSGDFRWASTATLLGSGLVEKTTAGWPPTGSIESWQWNPAGFDSAGNLAREFVTIQDPTDENCTQCHGVVHANVEAPLVLGGCTWETATTGQVFTAQRVSNSGMNVAAKSDITRAWDIHAERGLQCTDCHYSLNNPAYYQSDSAPEQLSFDPRRLEIGEYLQKPSHQFARGQSAQYTLAPELKATMRRCESCHQTESTHTWLPYAEQHFAKVACESCHAPKMYASALQQYDWTVVGLDGGPQTECRGLEQTTASLVASADPAIPPSVSHLVTGYEPALLQRLNIDGSTPLAPYNLITAWYWVYDDANGNTRPVRLQDLQAAWLETGRYAAAIVEIFDADNNNQLNDAELRIDTAEKQALIAKRLESLSLHNPRIAGEVQPYSISHDMARGEWVIKDCQVCHSAESRLTQPMKLASYVPGGVLPAFVKDANTATNGNLYTEDGALYYRPATTAQQLYVLGHDRAPWVDGVGAFAVLGTLTGVTLHGGLRFYAALRHPRRQATPALKQVYMYAVYERFWHWLQTFTLLLLVATGLIIHRPDMFALFSFRYVVIIHNILAVILVVNAVLALFYHLASGEIRQYLPRPYGFLDQAIRQARFYLRGIFTGERHPVEKTPQQKLNPLQQLTYFGILNVLLPLQVITGVLMWGAQQWPQAAALFGGLPFLAPFHSLIAWLFVAFIIAHVYLATTGHEPLANFKAMMLGWDEVEDHPAPTEEITTHDHTDTVQTQETGSESLVV